MHLWPSMRLRDSFKLGYLKNVEWNLHRMNSEKKQSDRSNQKKLLDHTCNNNNSNEGDDDVVVVSVDATSDSQNQPGVGRVALLVCREILMILSCCYCCFCCGACVAEEEY